MIAAINRIVSYTRSRVLWHFGAIDFPKRMKTRFVSFIAAAAAAAAASHIMKQIFDRVTWS